MKNKKILSPLLLILFLAGVLLLILGLILNGRNERTGTDTEKKEAELACFLENSKGVGQAQVRLCLDKEGEIKGVAVICQGRKRSAGTGGGGPTALRRTGPGHQSDLCFGQQLNSLGTGLFPEHPEYSVTNKSTMGGTKMQIMKSTEQKTERSVVPFKQQVKQFPEKVGRFFSASKNALSSSRLLY